MTCWCSASMVNGPVPGQLGSDLGGGTSVVGWGGACHCYAISFRFLLFVYYISIVFSVLISLDYYYHVSILLYHINILYYIIVLLCYYIVLFSIIALFYYHYYVVLLLYHYYIIMLLYCNFISLHGYIMILLFCFIIVLLLLYSVIVLLYYRVVISYYHNVIFIDLVPNHVCLLRRSHIPMSWNYLG